VSGDDLEDRCDRQSSLPLISNTPPQPATGQLTRQQQHRSLAYTPPDEFRQLSSPPTAYTTITARRSATCMAHNTTTAFILTAHNYLIIQTTANSN